MPFRRSWLARSAARPRTLWLTAVGDAAELLDVDVEQFAGPGALVPACGFAGGTVQRGQVGQVGPCRMRWAVEAAMPHRSGAMFVPQAQGLRHGSGWRAAGLMVRSASNQQTFSRT